MFQLQNRTWGKLVVPGDQIRAYAAGPKTLIRSRFQSYSGGSHWYNSQLSEPGEAAFEQVFHNVWTMLFTPSPPLATMIQNELHRMGLHPGQYVASHLRALYNREDRPEDQSRNWAENAVNCASELQPGVPMFFASDSPNATFYAKQYATAKRVPVFGTREPHPNPPLHLDRTKDWRRRPISDFYDSFVDLYLMALGSGCVTYNKGGYGHMGLMMGVNSSCALLQDALDKPAIHNPCHWSGGGSSNPTTGVLSLSESSSQKLMLFRPMED